MPLPNKAQPKKLLGKGTDWQQSISSTAADLNSEAKRIHWVVGDSVAPQEKKDTYGKSKNINKIKFKIQERL